MKIQSINPATEEVNKEFDSLTKEQVSQVCKDSKKAFIEWKKLKLEERTELISKLGKELSSNKGKYAKLITLEMGKTLKESIAEVEKCAWACDVYAQNASNWLQDEMIKTEAQKSFIRIEPLGTILSIMPWNFPFWQALRFGIPALTVGNVSILRHSNSVPMCSLAIEEAFTNAGFPENVFKSVLTDHDTVIKMIKNKNIDGISLTGSFGAGSDVAKVAGKYCKKFVLELGGSDAFIVLEGVDVETAAKKAVEGRNISNGQSCIAAKRFFVAKPIAKEFTEKVVALTKSLKVGDPMDPNTNIGPLASEQQLTKLEEQVKDATSRGAKLECGGKRLDGKGFFFQPAVLTDVSSSMKVAKEEVFGPVMPIIPIKNEKEAIRFTNSGTYGLGASIWTNDLEKAENIAHQLDVGMVYVNGIVKSDPRLPFGGVKQSGIGRELSRYGLLEFANIKSIVIT